MVQLASNLRSGALRSADITATDATTLHTIAVTRMAIDRDALLQEIKELPPSADGAALPQPTSQPPVPVASDPIVQATIDLRSGDPQRITAVLSNSVLSRSCCRI